MDPITQPHRPHGVDPHGVDPHGVDPHWVELDAVVTRAEHIRREIARLHAERADLCAEALDLVAVRVEQRAAAGVEHRGALGDDIPLREVVAELGAALRVGDRTVHGWLDSGSALVHRYPATLRALRAGAIDERHAAAILDAGAAVEDDGLRAEYERRVLEVAVAESAARVRAAARTIAARLQRDLVDDRQRRAHERRRVRLYDIEDGLTRLVADLPAALARAAFERVSDLAAAVDDDDDVDGDGERDDRCLDERRADVLCDLLIGGAPAAHPDLRAGGAAVRVTVPLLTLAGVDDDPAILDGHGPIDAGTARRLAAAAPGWERVVQHPLTGEVLACDRYRPSAALRRLIDARDEHCRWPGCRRAARRCDADHTVAYAEGGDTAASNLALFCRRHHRLKHASPWRVRQLGGGRLEFRSPTGRTYLNDAPTVVAFVPHDRVAPESDDAPPF
ncbi:HNH endonuclease signature motif containing protein [Microbacterium sp. T2.11-28]|uniref:HNH endonuclease signature motif containing protein n=1 Tax=Microbacterium sp. T2.11-28 TaxID=3041169 RepID=UPI002477C3BB|nr:HNH endonuclease signature motif containing protein [Microbacterium sp. T2.11-28]CAI9389409.1 hypothetical protein MICABA_01087 [Microbacterium sp. T2.11-28]